MSSEKKKTRKIIVIAGAGASAPLGYSTLFDFEAAIAQYAPKTTAQEKRELAFLFQQIRRSLVAGGEYTDFEAILWRFSNYLDLCHKLRLDQFLANQFLSTVSDRFRYSAFAQRIGQGQSIVDNVILNHYGYQSINEDAKKKVLKVFQGLINKNGGVLDYFTTNYDVGLESIWSRISKDTPLVTGIENPLDLSGEWNSSLLATSKPNRQGLYVHRLHGCVRWFRHISPKKSDDNYKIQANPKLIEDREWEACVLYPGRKYNTSQPPFSDSFKRFRRALSDTACVIIIGTSFRDNNLIEYLLEANDKSKMPLTILISDVSDVKPRFFQKIRDVRYRSHFHYSKTEWKVKFLVGDYTSILNDKKINYILDNLDSIKLINENTI